MALRATAAAPGASGRVRLTLAWSPFGVELRADGRHVWDLEIEITGIARPETYGAAAIVAWAVSPDLTEQQKLGVVRPGETVRSQTDLNKFLVVVTAEPSPDVSSRSGAVLLRGMSPSSFLQSFLGHELFGGIRHE